MTIKQILIGTVLGSSIVGLMVHRMRKEKDLISRPRLVATSKLTSHKVSKSFKARKHSGSNDTEVSSRKLYG